MNNRHIKGFCLALSVLLVLHPFFTVGASESSAETQNMVLVSQTTEQISDDMYIEISVYEESIVSRASEFEKDGVKTYRCRTQDGEIIWTFSVKGIFIVNQGVSAVCTSSVSSHEIYNNNWHFSGSTCRASGNQAIGDAEFIRKLLGITVETETCHVVLTCDVNGNFS